MVSQSVIVVVDLVFSGFSSVVGGVSLARLSQCCMLGVSWTEIYYIYRRRLCHVTKTFQNRN